MNIRKKLNENSKASMAVAGTVLLVIAVWLFYPQGGGRVREASSAYYSDDDGKTFFEDDASKVAPFSRNGREVASAVVFDCGNGKPFVGYLERAAGAKEKTFVEQTRKQIITRAATQPSGLPDSDLIEQVTRSLEVKRPGDSNWVNAASAAAVPIYGVKCPGGAAPQPVAP